MSLKDWNPPSFKPFATRHGGATGHANERKMADAISGTDSTRTVIRTHPDGSTTMLRTRNGFPEYTTITRARPPQSFSAVFLAVATMTAKFSEVYMTSGAYTFGALGGINEADPSLTPSPVTYKSSAVAATEATTLTPLYFQAPPANGEVSKIYDQTMLPSGLNGPKAAMYGARPSQFSGLMRRCMQGRYGVGNTSDNLVTGDIGGSVLVENSFARTTGIIRFNAVDYFLVVLQSGGGGLGVTAYPIHFTDGYEQYVDGSTAGDVKALETLALSHATVVPDEGFLVGNYDIPMGLSIEYGWSFSEASNKATIVINELLYEGYDRRQYSHLSISFTYSSPLISCGVSTVESVDGWIVPAQAPIWSPADGSTIWYNRRATSPIPASPQDFPVHAYYVGDILRVIRWKWVETAVSGDWSTHWAACGIEGWANNVIGSGTTQYDRTENYGAVRTHGFYVAGATDAPKSSSSYRRNADSATVFYTAPPPADCPTPLNFSTALSSAYRVYFNPDQDNSHNPRVSPWTASSYALGVSPPDQAPGNHYGQSVISYSAYTQRTITETGSSTHSTALVIPATDCCAAYVASKVVSNLTRATGIAHGGMSNPTRVDEWQGLKIVDPYTQLFIGWELVGRWGAAVERQFSISGKELWGAASTTVDSNTNITTTESSIRTQLIGGDVKVVGSIDSEIFFPGALHDVLSQQVTAISSSIYNDARYNSGTLIGTTEATSGYPTDITLFVGAS